MAERTPLDAAELAAALMALRPRAAGLDRDELFYRAGRASVASPSGRRLWRRRMPAAAGWIAAAVFCGLWCNRPAVMSVVETQPAPMPSATTVVEQPIASEMSVVDHHGRADQSPAPQVVSSLPVQPVTHFGFDDFRHNRVSLVGSFTKSDHDQPIASATDGNQRPTERATYAELMREYLPRSSELPHGMSSPLQSVDTGDRT
jgi:hypothetical protein